MVVLPIVVCPDPPVCAPKRLAVSGQFYELCGCSLLLGRLVEALAHPL
jgi:hypothetical protein